MVLDTGLSMFLIHRMLLWVETVLSAFAISFYFISWFEKEWGPVQHALVDIIGNGVLILLLAVLNNALDFLADVILSNLRCLLRYFEANRHGGVDYHSAFSQE